MGRILSFFGDNSVAAIIAGLFGLVGCIGTLVVAYIGIYQNTAPIELIIKATQTAEAKLTSEDQIIATPSPSTFAKLTEIPANEAIAISKPTFTPQKTTPTLQQTDPEAIPTAYIKGYDSVQPGGERHITLTEGELIVGTADRFQDDVHVAGQPPCTAFAIRGPIDMDLRVWHGGWDHWANIYDEEVVEILLSRKVSELEQHETCPSRGINVVRFPTFLPNSSSSITPSFGEMSFCLPDKVINLRCTDPQTVFQSPVTRIDVCWPYHNVRHEDKMIFSRKWYWLNQPTPVFQKIDDIWDQSWEDDGESECTYLDASGGEVFAGEYLLRPGSYTVELYIGKKLEQRGNFTISEEE